MAKTVTEKEAELMAKKDVKKQEVKRFSTGISHLDCIFSEGENSKEFGWPVGKVIGVNSKSKGGKTRLAFEALFSMLVTYGKENVEYLDIDAESGNSIDTEECYGFSLKDRATIKAENSKEPVTVENIKLVEEMQVIIHDFCDNKDPKKKGFIIMDSLDAVGCTASESNLEERRKKYHSKDGKIEKIKSYGADKPKLLAEIMPLIASRLAETDTNLFYIHHQKQAFNASPFEKSTYVSGGTATGFYPTIMLELRASYRFGDRGLETGYLLEVFADKTRTKHERRYAYIAIDHLMGFDPVKSNIIYLYDLITDKRQYDEKKASALKWEKEWSPENSVKEVEGVTNEQYKEFGEKHNLRPFVTEDGSKYTIGNIKKYIFADSETRLKFAEEFGVMDIDTLCAYVEQNELEEELDRRCKEKFFAIERSLRPVERKSRRLQ